MKLGTGKIMSQTSERCLPQTLLGDGVCELAKNIFDPILWACNNKKSHLDHFLFNEKKYKAS